MSLPLEQSASIFVLKICLPHIIYSQLTSGMYVSRLPFRACEGVGIPVLKIFLGRICRFKGSISLCFLFLRWGGSLLLHLSSPKSIPGVILSGAANVYDSSFLCTDQRKVRSD